MSSGTRASGWLVVVSMLGVAEILSFGHFDPHALILATLGVAAGAWSALRPGPERGSPTTAALVLCVEAMALVGLVHPPLSYCESGAWVSCYALGLLIAVPLVASYLVPGDGRGPWERSRFLVLLALVVAARISVPLVSPRPGEDVWWVQQEAAAGLLSGRDPYAIHYSQIFAPEVYRAFGYHSGFHYPPLTLIPILPAYLLLHDVRWAYVACEMLILFAAWKLTSRRSIPRANRELLLWLWGLSSPVLQVLEHGWTEPLGLALLAAALLLLQSGRRIGGSLTLAALFSYKQYMLLMAPLLLFLPGPAVALGFVAITVASAAPWLVLGIRGVVDSLIEPWRAYPRPDGLSFAALWLQMRGAPAPAWLSPAFLLGAMNAALVRIPREPAGLVAALFVVLAALFLTAKQSFVNYYYFLGYLALTSCILAAGAPRPVEIARAADPSPEA